jgi:hypothetical protein
MPVLDFVNNKDLHSMTRTAHSAHGMQRAASPLLWSALVLRACALGVM